MLHARAVAAGSQKINGSSKPIAKDLAVDTDYVIREVRDPVPRRPHASTCLLRHLDVSTQGPTCCETACTRSSVAPASRYASAISSGF